MSLKLVDYSSDRARTPLGTYGEILSDLITASSPLSPPYEPNAYLWILVV